MERQNGKKDIFSFKKYLEHQPLWYRLLGGFALPEDIEYLKKKEIIKNNVK